VSQDAFVRRHGAAWRAFELEVRRLEEPGARAADPGWPARYRQVCQQLALARHRRYGADVVQRLNQLAALGHAHLHGQRVLRPWAGLLALALEVPRVVRREWRAVLAAHLLFYLPFCALFIGVMLVPELVFSVIEPAQVTDLEGMYDPSAPHHREERAAAGDLGMFGFYIQNNVGIAFRTFAGGVLFGMGSVFFLIYNGLFLGAAAGHLTAIGSGSTFWTFVGTHGAFELTAIALAGAAGLRLGGSLLAPGRRTRSRALREDAQALMPMVWAFTGMLVVAAVFEAFWSSSALLPPPVKWASAAVCWPAVYAWLLLAGRGRAA